MTVVNRYGAASQQPKFTKYIITAARSKVCLITDYSSNSRDRYNHLLRYVYPLSGRLLNQKLIENVYGFYYPYFLFSNKTDFETAGQCDRDGAKGLFFGGGNCRLITRDHCGYISNSILSVRVGTRLVCRQSHKLGRRHATPVSVVSFSDQF